MSSSIGHGEEDRGAAVDHGRALVLVGLLLLLLLIVAEAARAQDSHHAALVVRYSDERTESVCVSFSEETITGYDLLQRSGLDLASDNSGAGVKICRIDDTGCPSGNCFCQCQGDPCVYWSYWQRRDGAWQYAIAGAAVNEVEDGAVEGWSWGPGSVSEAIAPPETSFEDVCAPTPPVTSPTAAAASSVPGPENSAAPTPMVNPGAGQAAGTDDGASLWTYGAFVLLLLALGGFFIWTRTRSNT